MKWNGAGRLCRSLLALKMRRNTELPDWVMDVAIDVCVGNGVALDELYCERLSRKAAHVRNIVVYIIRVIGGGQPSFPDLGVAFGKHHSTLVAGDRTIRAQLKSTDFHSQILNKRINAFLDNYYKRQGELECHTGEALDLTRDTSQHIN